MTCSFGGGASGFGLTQRVEDPVIFYQFEFEAPLDVLDYGRMKYRIVRMPEALKQSVPFQGKSRLRITGEMAEEAFDGAWIPDGEQGWYLIINTQRAKRAKLTIGTPVEVRFNVADQDGVEVPETLQRALDADPEAQARWDALTPGRQRGFAYRIGSAKTTSTINKRIAELFDELASKPPKL